MFATVCFIISAMCFISAHGCHVILRNNNDPSLWCGYLASPLLCTIPWISGYILAVIPECLVFNIAWYWMFLINLAVNFILGPIITGIFLARMSGGKGLGYDAFKSLIIGIVSLLLGLIFH